MAPDSDGVLERDTSTLGSGSDKCDALDIYNYSSRSKLRLYKRTIAFAFHENLSVDQEPERQ
jgi:hypothetical protein